mmetsp:Transcript_96529/g.268288  ORF Transcript_96529/g.268288 Transcript_96529/m.268288 type:complete len:208 (+) Transcript_96529:418-1041(+)
MRALASSFPPLQSPRSRYRCHHRCRPVPPCAATFHQRQALPACILSARAWRGLSSCSRPDAAPALTNNPETAAAAVASLALPSQRSSWTGAQTLCAVSLPRRLLTPSMPHTSRGRSNPDVNIPQTCGTKLWHAWCPSSGDRLRGCWIALHLQGCGGACTLFPKGCSPTSKRMPLQWRPSNTQAWRGKRSCLSGLESGAQPPRPISVG